ncbi:MAG: hypothetical protein C0507_23665 [Cyanobacteria bacterium PR.3.49]|jgi:hypothetical protein|nr:hypothetical protein [Cyanobacteria bacterium PR.3.49]
MSALPSMRIESLHLFFPHAMLIFSIYNLDEMRFGVILVKVFPPQIGSIRSFRSISIEQITKSKYKAAFWDEPIDN